MTKEELLQKGISEENADEIIASFGSGNNSENSLQALEKALNFQNLKKADADEGDDTDDDNDEEYNEEYMKKYMKRYMMENKKACGKMAKEVGIFGDKMQKAIEDVDLNADAAIIETTDLKSFLENQSNFNQEMVKAVSNIFDQIELISSKSEETYQLMKKAATVQVEIGKNINKTMSLPVGRKGVIASDATMQKAITIPNNKKIVYETLLKARKNGDQKAGFIISMFESSGQNINALNKEQRAYVNELLMEVK